MPVPVLNAVLKENKMKKQVGVLIGYGENCTCSDCPVLYGGECLTTKENNTMDKKLAEVRAKVIEAVPGILDLNFGCGVETKDGIKDKILSVAGNKKDCRLQYIEDADIRDLHILGRPIRLADVLFSVKQKDRNLEKQFADDHLGHAPIKYNFFYQCMMSITKYDMDGGEFWNLTDDDLSHQSEDTINFLYGILCQ